MFGPEQGLRESAPSGSTCVKYLVEFQVLRYPFRHFFIRFRDVERRIAFHALDENLESSDRCRSFTAQYPNSIRSL